jgi:NAD(P)-dependent dehydrogenase (short-subunit alcohol dehydrogenase family)
VDLELRNRTFLITGGTDGLGLALAQQLVADGANVAVCGRDEARLARAREELGSTGYALRADVTNDRDCVTLVAAVVERFGGLDGLVNNAGKSAGVAVESSTDEMWREDYELKVMAAVRLARLCVPELRQRGGAIVNVLATRARTPVANSTPTSASRAAGLALTKALASELGPDGVRVNAILVGLIESGQWVRMADLANTPLPDFYERMAHGANIPLGRVGRASEFADLASYLLSSRASYITGVGINLDGGMTPTI